MFDEEIKLSVRSRRRQAKFQRIVAARSAIERMWRRVARDRYPGPCLCGHKFYDHHDAEVFVGKPGHPWMWAAGECERYGSNEGGGLAADGKTIHCLRYKPAWKLAPSNGGW